MRARGGINGRARTGLLLLTLLTVSIALAVGIVSGCTNPTQTTNEPATPTPSAEATTPSAPTSTAEPTAPTGQTLEGPTHTIAQVLNAPKDGEAVVLVGRISQMSGAENFTLRDDTGEIFVDGDNDFGPLAKGDALLVRGAVKVEDSPQRVEIKAASVEPR